jgi:hypothetical protein
LWARSVCSRSYRCSRRTPLGAKTPARPYATNSAASIPTAEISTSVTALGSQAYWRLYCEMRGDTSRQHAAKVQPGPLRPGGAMTATRSQPNRWLALESGNRSRDARLHRDRIRTGSGVPEAGGHSRIRHRVVEPPSPICARLQRQGSFWGGAPGRIPLAIQGYFQDDHSRQPLIMKMALQLSVLIGHSCRRYTPPARRTPGIGPDNGCMVKFGG